MNRILKNNLSLRTPCAELQQAFVPLIKGTAALRAARGFRSLNTVRLRHFCASGNPDYVGRQYFADAGKAACNAALRKPARKNFDRIYRMNRIFESQISRTHDAPQDFCLLNKSRMPVLVVSPIKETTFLNHVNPVNPVKFQSYSRSARRSILPTLVLGNSLRNSTNFGTL